MKSPLKGLILGVSVAALLGLGVAASAADSIKDWQRSIAMAVAKKQVYPRSALRRELEGSAKVKVTLSRDGTISAFETLESTGHDEFDKEIPKLMERINPLPAPPAELADNDLTFILPLAWVLR